MNRAIPVRAKTRWGILLMPSIGTLIVFFFSPLAILAVYSLETTENNVVLYSLANYQKFVSDPFYWTVLTRTLLVAFVVATGAVVIGFPLAYTLARSNSRWKLYLVVLVVLPLVTNLVVRNYGWMVIMSSKGVLNALVTSIGLPPATLLFTTTGVIIALIHVTTPFAVFSLYGVVQQIKPELEESVRNLGGGPFHVIKDVLIPLSRSGIAAGWLLVFVQSIAAFATPMLIGGGGKPGQLISTLIFNEANNTLNWRFASAMSFIVTAVALFLVALQIWILDDSHKR